MQETEIQNKELLIELKRLRTENKSLRRSVERHRSFFTNSQNAYFLIEDMLIVDCNRLAANYFDEEPNQVIGKTMLNFSQRLQNNSETADFILMEYLKRAADRGAFSFEWGFVKEDGEEFSKEVFISVVVLNNKFLFICEILDQSAFISNAGLTDSQANQNQLILDNIEDLYFLTDVNGKLQLVSRNVEEFTGWSE